MERGLYIALWPAKKNEPTRIIPSAENHGAWPDMPARRRPDRVFTVPRLCSTFGGISSVWYIISGWKGVKTSHRISVSNAIDAIEPAIEEETATVRIERRQSYAPAWQCSATSQDRSRHTSKCWNGRFHPTRCTLQTLLLPNTICFDRWHTAWLISISSVIKE